jgi:phage/plasmid-associated DNA primase
MYPETFPPTPAFSKPLDEMDNYDCPTDDESSSSSNPETATEKAHTVFDWKLSPIECKSSIYLKTPCRERVNKQLIYGFVRNNMGISFQGDHKNDYLSKMYPTELDMIKSYKDKMNRDGFELGEFSTSYHLARHKWGRAIPADNLSLSVFHRPTRHRLASDAYIDIDMINAQPTMVSEICRHHNTPCPRLNEYVADPKSARENIMKHHNCKKDAAKRLILRIMFGGTYDAWIKEYDIKENATKRLESVMEIEKETKAIMEIVYNANQHMKIDVLKHDKNKWKTSAEAKRGVMGLWSQSIEKLVQETAISFLVNKKGFALEDIVPSQDGFMIFKELWYDGILDECGSAVKETYNLSIGFLDKPFDEAIEIPAYEDAKSYEEWDALLSSKELADKFLDLYGDNVVMSGDKLFVFYEEQRKTENEEQKTGRWFDETDEKKRHKLTIMISENLYSNQFEQIGGAVELKKWEREKLLKLNRRMTSALCNVKDIIRHIITRAKHTLTEFDSKPFLIGFENGVYDLSKEEFRHYTYEDYITISTNYNYTKPNYNDPEIAALKKSLVEIINTIHPNPEKRKLYLQTLASGLDGKLYQKLFLFNGQGGNGKGLTSSLMNIVLGCCYFHKPNNGIIKDMDSEKANTPSPDIAGLQHKRFIQFEEVEGSISGAMVKNLTGGGPKTGRFLGQNPISFELVATIIMYFNDTHPEFDGEMGEAFYRRLVNLFFEVNFTDEDEKVGTVKGNVRYAKGNVLYESMDWRLSVRDIFLDMLLDEYKENLSGRSAEDKHRGIIFTIPECVKEATSKFMDNQNPFNKIVKDLFNEIKVEKDEKGKGIVDSSNSITLTDMFDDISHSIGYLELSSKQKRTYNRKAFKKWVGNEYHLFTPKDSAERVVGVIRIEGEFGF